MTTPVATPRAADGGTHRLFFALWPDDATRDAIAAAAASLRARCPSGRWIPASRYHLTLHFLGTHPRYPASLVDAACAAGERVRSREAAITLDRIASFPRRPRLWWLGSGHPEALLPLWERLGCELAVQGLPAGPASFTPHVTLVRGADAAPPADAAVPPVVWRPPHFVLIHSRSEVGTTNYQVVHRWPLDRFGADGTADGRKAPE